MEKLAAIIEHLKRTKERIMSALTDLQAVATSLEADVSAAITLLQNLQSGAVNADDPQVEAVVTALQASDTALKAALTPPAAAASSTKTSAS